MTILAPGSTIGILGGGQLGRMTALAAGALGYRCHIYDPAAEDGPAAQVSAASTTAAWDDKGALKAFANAVDVVTYEFENVPVLSVEFLETLVPVRPGSLPLRVAQDRLEEKQFSRHVGLETTPFWGVGSIDELADGVTGTGVPAILKSRRFGYDGKGQVSMDLDTPLGEAWRELGTEEAILERRVAFKTELSVIVARDLAGNMVSFPPAKNEHADGILRRSLAPADLPAQFVEEAIKAAEILTEKLEVVGLLAVEMFISDRDEVLINEMAPRPHNSGHWTQDGCATSQFEQLVRAVTGLPLGPVDALFETEMINLIGEDVDAWPEIAGEAGAKMHLYGKGESRPGRKMGHVNRRLRAL